MSHIENVAAQLDLNLHGMYGCSAILALDADKIVTSTNMKNGTYTVAAQPLSPARISVLATAVQAADTMGTVTIVGTDATGDALTEVVTPIAGTTVLTTGIFKTITSVTGAGWSIGEGNDTIVVGVNYAYPPTGYYFCAIQAIADTVVASQTDVTDATNPTLAAFTKIPAGTTVYGKYASVNLTSGEAIGYFARSS